MSYSSRANVQIRKILVGRGNTSVTSTYSGVRGEVVMDTDLKTLRVHDGVQTGGYILARQSYVDAAVANVQVGSTYSNANVKSYLTQLDGNIIPTGNAVYSLGSVNHQWKDLWVSNATIYLNSVPLGLDTSGNLTFNGNPLVSFVNGSLSIGGSDVTINGITAGEVLAGNLILTLSDSTTIDVGQVVGPQGPQGPQGEQGIQGQAGLQGPQGEQGIRGNVGPAGPEGPQGIQGIQGNVGEQGPRGFDGNIGPQGPQGDRGEQGIQGNVGPTGPQGIQGNIGPQGIQGIQGIKGDRGDQGISVTLVGNVSLPEDLNFSGNAGEAYIVNSTGNLFFWNTTISSWADIGPIVGPRGDKGDTGDQGIQGETGPQGEVGPAGEQGPQGPAGEAGLQGDPGETGPQGEAGPAGEQGPQGPQGDQGPAGEAGPQGDIGPQGDQGPEGPQGIEGPAGVGVPAGGTTGQVLAKVDGDDYHTEWVDQSGGDTGDITFNGTQISTEQDNTITIRTTTSSDDDNQLVLNNNSVELYAYNDDDNSWAEVLLNNQDTDAPYADIWVKSSSGDEKIWRFGHSGSITFPDATVQTTAFTGFPDLVVAEETAPETGILWFNTNEARMYIKYNEQWVDASPTVLTPPVTELDINSVTFNDATVQTTAWTGTVSYRNITDAPVLFSGNYNDLTNRPVTPAFVGGGGADTWLTAD